MSNTLQMFIDFIKKNESQLIFNFQNLISEIIKYIYDI